MQESYHEKAKEIRALASHFLRLADVTTQADYKTKLQQTATRLTSAADALDLDQSSACGA